MSRPKRILRKKFVVFCEGDTEYNYINGMRTRQGVEISLKPINMQGGGYAHFIDELKTKGQSNCLARFIIIDGDRLRDDSGERNNFLELLAYCRRENGKGAIPCFLIVNSPDFEYVACSHAPAYSNQQTEKYIIEVFGMKSLTAFKSKTDIYEFLNSAGRSYSVMLNKMKNSPRVVENKYHIHRQTFDVQITKTEYQEENASRRGSNIAELFEVIDWK